MFCHILPFMCYIWVTLLCGVLGDHTVSLFFLIGCLTRIPYPFTLLGMAYSFSSSVSHRVLLTIILLLQLFIYCIWVLCFFYLVVKYCLHFSGMYSYLCMLTVFSEDLLSLYCEGCYSYFVYFWHMWAVWFCISFFCAYFIMFQLLEEYVVLVNHYFCNILLVANYECSVPGWCLPCALAAILWVVTICFVFFTLFALAMCMQELFLFYLR